MMATHNSEASATCAVRNCGVGALFLRGRRTAWGSLVLLAAFRVCLAAAEDDIHSKLARRAEQTYLEARKQFRSKTNDAAVMWQFGRACFDRAEFATDDDQREQLANEGIAVCRQLVAKDPKSAGGHYYLGLNLGQLARTKTLGALKLVLEMEKEFKSCRDLDETFDYAGADRNLGLLYFEAPGWPASIGSKSKARQHLRRAVELAGHYPANRLCLLEAYLEWGETKELQRERKSLAELWERAKKEFSGEAWEESWVSWERRWKIIQQKIGK
jgi:tetratricopeptide (TPR) repeat protein